jgi:hypothetical protein
MSTTLEHTFACLASQLDGCPECTCALVDEVAYQRELFHVPNDPYFDFLYDLVLPGKK